MTPSSSGQIQPTNVTLGPIALAPSGTWTYRSTQSYGASATSAAGQVQYMTEVPRELPHYQSHQPDLVDVSVGLGLAALTAYIALKSLDTFHFSRSLEGSDADPSP